MNEMVCAQALPIAGNPCVGRAMLTLTVDWLGEI
jgi:hypothetical protein